MFIRHLLLFQCISGSSYDVVSIHLVIYKIFNVDTGVVSPLEGTQGSLQQMEINELVVTIPQIVSCGNRSSSHG